MTGPTIVAIFAVGRSSPTVDEERGDQAPGDERADVRHDHVGQERAELLDVHAQRRSAAASSAWLWPC